MGLCVGLTASVRMCEEGTMPFVVHYIHVIYIHTECVKLLREDNADH